MQFTHCRAAGLAAATISVLLLAVLTGPGWVINTGLRRDVVPETRSGTERWLEIHGVDGINWLGESALAGSDHSLQQLVTIAKFSDAGYATQSGIELWRVFQADPPRILRQLAMVRPEERQYIWRALVVATLQTEGIGCDQFRRVVQSTAPHELHFLVRDLAEVCDFLRDLSRH